MSTESAPASSFGAPPLSITPDLSETFFSNGHDYEPFGDLGRSSSGASHVLVRCKRHVEVGGHALSRSTELFAKLIVIPVGGDAGSNQGVDDVARTIAPFESASHPNLIPWIEHYIWEKPPQQWRSLLNAGENDIVVVIIMERALFGDVRRLWSTVEVFRLSERDALTICAQVASAIQYLQLNSIPCPELKPSKVLVMSTTPDKGFHVCIAPGFGRVRKVSTTDDEAARSKYDGSGDADPYAAPEVLRGQPVTSKAHTWSLGVVLYEMLTGHKLVIDILALRTRLENLKHLSAHVRDVLCNLLTLDPANRPSMEAARTLIQLALAATPATVDQQPEGDSDNPTASPIGSDRSPAKLKLRSPSRSPSPTSPSDVSERAGNGPRKRHTTNGSKQLQQGPSTTSNTEPRPPDVQSDPVQHLDQPMRTQPRRHSFTRAQWTGMVILSILLIVLALGAYHYQHVPGPAPPSTENSTSADFVPRTLIPLRELIIAIDFGTVGVAWCHALTMKRSMSPELLNATRASMYVLAPSYPLSLATCDVSRDKSSNALLYPANSTASTAFGNAAIHNYDLDAITNSSLFVNFKKALNGENVSGDTLVYSDGGGRPMPLATLLRDSFTYIHSHVSFCVINRLYNVSDLDGQELLKSAVFVVTVPAIWSNKAKALMRQAAFEGGLISTLDSPQLRFALEPEAALMETALLSNYPPGTIIMMVDAGGGTVDIVLAKVLRGTPLSLHIISRASGGLWGGTEVNHRFITLLRDLFSEYPLDPLSAATHALHDVETQFEELKRTIVGPSSEFHDTNTITIQLTPVLRHLLPDSSAEEQSELLKTVVRKYIANHALKQGAISVNKQMLILKDSFVASEFFEPVLEQTMMHISTLLAGSTASTRVNYIVAAGSFAQSAVFQDRLRVVAGAHGIKFAVASNPGVAVVRGAAILGSFPSDAIASRVVGYSYAIRLVKNVTDRQEEFAHCKLEHYDEGVFVHYFAPLAIEGEHIKVDEKRARTLYPQFDHASSATIGLYRSRYPFSGKDDEVCVPKDGTSDDDNLRLYLNPNRPEATIRLVDIGSSSLSRDSKPILLDASFGRAEIQVEAIAKATGEQHNVTLDFI